jgi:hypothetical protein
LNHVIDLAVQAFLKSNFRVGNEPSEPSDEHDLMSRAERDVFLLIAHEQR